VEISIYNKIMSLDSSSKLRADSEHPETSSAERGEKRPADLVIEQLNTAAEKASEVAKKKILGKPADPYSSPGHREKMAAADAEKHAIVIRQVAQRASMSIEHWRGVVTDPRKSGVSFEDISKSERMKGLAPEAVLSIGVTNRSGVKTADAFWARGQSLDNVQVVDEMNASQFKGHEKGPHFISSMEPQDRLQMLIELGAITVEQAGDLTQPMTEDQFDALMVKTTGEANSEKYEAVLQTATPGFTVRIRKGEVRDGIIKQNDKMLGAMKVRTMVLDFKNALQQSLA